MKTRILIKKTKAVLVTNIVALLLVNVGGVGFLTPSTVRAEQNEQAYLNYSCTDINGSGSTDIVDMSYFADHYASAGICIGNVKYDEKADFNGSGCIDDIDKTIFSTFFINPSMDNVYCRGHESLESVGVECPDIDNSGRVNSVDLTMFADAYRKYAGEPGYNSDADFDQDGYVGDIDKAIFSQAYTNPNWTSPYCATAVGSMTVNAEIDTNGDSVYEGGNTEANTLGLRWGMDGVTPKRQLGTTADRVAVGSHTVEQNVVSGYHFTGWYRDAGLPQSKSIIESYGEVGYSCSNPEGISLPVTLDVFENQTSTLILCSALDTIPTEETDDPPAEDIVKPIEPIIRQPLLTLTVTNDAATFVAPGGLVNYVATVKNTGNESAKNVKVLATLPNGLFFTDTLGVEKLLTSGGSLGPNDTMTLKYQGTVKNDTINGIYKDAVRVTSDNNPELNGGTSVEVRVPAVETSKTTTLGVTIKANVPFANPGDTVKYSVNVSNTGQANAVDVHLKVTLPNGQTFSETGSSTREWTLGDIAVGAKNEVTFDGLVSATAPAGMGTIGATASSVSISAAVTATMDLEVKLPQVLGAEITPETPGMTTLPATGVGVVDYLIVLFVGSVGLLLGVRWWRLRHHTGYAAGK